MREEGEKRRLGETEKEAERERQRQRQREREREGGRGREGEGGREREREREGGRERERGGEREGRSYSLQSRPKHGTHLLLRPVGDGFIPLMSSLLLWWSRDGLLWCMA